MNPSAPRAIPLWFPLALLALLIAWPTVDEARAADHATQLIVADLRADELLVIDTREERVVQRIALPGGGHELLELPDGRIVVSIEQQGLLAVVNLETSEVVTLPVGGRPHGLALDAGVLLVTDRSVDQIRRFEVDSWRELDPLVASGWPHAVALNADGAIVVTSALGHSIAIGDETHRVSDLPETIDVANDGAIATAGAVGGALHLFATNGTEVLRLALGGRPVRVLFSPDGQLIAVALTAAGEVALVDRQGNVRRASVPGVPDGLAFDASGDRLYVSDVVGGGIAVLEVNDLALLTVIEGGTATGALLVR